MPMRKRQEIQKLPRTRTRINIKSKFRSVRKPVGTPFFRTLLFIIKSINVNKSHSTIISINGLKKNLNSGFSIDIPDFKINNGEILGLVGNNGAGKTTMFRLMLDLLKADEGTITMTVSTDDSQPETQQQKITISESEVWKQHIGAYIDEGFLIDFLTAEEYFDFLGKISEISQDTVRLNLQSFDHFTNNEIFGKKKLIRNMSAGNKQKIGIMSAFFRHPDVVILDEPFNYLDPTGQNILKNIITEYAGQTGNTVIISSHNLSHTVDICSRIVLLEHGHIIRDIPNNDVNAVIELKKYFET